MTGQLGFPGIVIIGVIAGGLAGCAPTLAGGNEAGGVVRHVTGGMFALPLALATTECAKYGKVARMRGRNVLDATERYDCIPK